MAETLADQADREQAQQREETLKAQREREQRTDKWAGADEFVVLAPYVTLRVKDPNGGPLRVVGFNEGAIVRGEDVDEANLRHHLDITFLAPKDADEARFAGPAGTPKPGEPPNVPVEEGTPVEMVPHEERLARQQRAARDSESGQRGSRQRQSPKANG